MLLGHPVADLAVILKKLPTGTLIQEWLIVYLILFIYFILFYFSYSTESIILALATRVQKSLKEEGSTAGIKFIKIIL